MARANRKHQLYCPVCESTTACTHPNGKATARHIRRHMARRRAGLKDDPFFGKRPGVKPEQEVAA